MQPYILIIKDNEGYKFLFIDKDAFLKSPLKWIFMACFNNQEAKMCCAAWTCRRYKLNDQDCSLAL